MDLNPLAFWRSLIRRFLNNPLLQRVVRNAGYLFSAQTFSAAMSFGQGVLAARLLGVAGAGYVGLSTQFSSNINRLTSFRMAELVVNFVGDFNAKQQERHAAALFKAAALIEITSSIIAYIMILALSPLGARIFAHNPELSGLFALYGFSVLANLMSESSTGLLQYFDRFRSLAFIMGGQALLTLLLILGAFIANAGLQSVVLAYLFGKVLWAVSVSMAGIWQARRAWGPGWWRTPLSLLQPRRRELVRFAVSRNINGTLKLVTRDSEALWLGAFSSPLQVGYYKIAKAIMNVVIMPVDPLISTTYREVAVEVANRRWKNVRYLLRSGSLISAAWTLPASLGLLLFGRYVVSIYGPEFLPTSFDSLLILLIGVLAVNIFYWNQSVLLPLGMPEYPTKVQSVGAVLKIAGTILLVPMMGAVGMAALLSGYFIFISGTLVWKTCTKLNSMELQTASSEG
jgi:O-antigen/teichoic acid export membrane protein